MWAGAGAVDVHVHAIHRLAGEAGHIVRELEHLPDSKAIAQRRAAGLGLTRPELALLLAYAKITATQSLVASDLPDEVRTAGSRRLLPVHCESALPRRWCSTRCVAKSSRPSSPTSWSTWNTFLFRVVGETAASVLTSRVRTRHSSRVSRRRAVARDRSARRRGRSDVQTGLLGVRQLLDRATRWFLANRRPPIDVLRR